MISIVIAAYNSENFIKESLDSIFSQDLKNYEVIIIDNNSKDDTKEIIRNYRQITLIENGINAGFSKAYNQGIDKARGSYILCLNHDIRLTEGFLTQIKQAIFSNDKLGAIQPKVLNISGDKIDTTGIYFSFLRRFYNIGAGKQDQIKFNKPQYVFGASAAAVLYRKEALESIKQSNNEYFDEDFFCIAEDVDLSWRLQKKGWRTLYAPEAVCIHKGGISRHKDKYTQCLSMRNRYLMILKNENFWGFLRLPLVLIIYDLWRNLFMLIFNRKYCIEAHGDIIKLSGKIFNKRL